MKAEITVAGAKELDAKMAKLIQDLGPEDVEPVFMEGAEKVKKAGIPVTPYDPRRKKGKHLNQAWVTKLLTRRGRIPAPAMAAIDYHTAPYMHLVEGGTAARYTRAGAFRGAAKKQPFFKKNFNRNKAEVQTNIIQKLIDIIQKSWKGS